MTEEQKRRRVLAENRARFLSTRPHSIGVDGDEVVVVVDEMIVRVPRTQLRLFV